MQRTKKLHKGPIQMHTKLWLNQIVNKKVVALLS